MKRSSSAFSLVEVVLALGVVSFSLVALIGMLPVGLSNFRQAIEIQTQAQIVQQIATELQLAKYSDLSSGGYQSGFPRYFDAEGAAVAEPSKLYTVTASLPTNAEVPGPVANTNLLTLNFSIQRKTGPNDPKTFTLLVSNNGF